MNKHNQTTSVLENSDGESSHTEVIWGKTYYKNLTENEVARTHTHEPWGYHLTLVKTEEGGFVCHLDKGVYNPIASFKVPDGMGSVMADVDRAVLEDYKIQQKEAAETESQVSSVFAGAKRAT